MPAALTTLAQRGIALEISWQNSCGIAGVA